VYAVLNLRVLDMGTVTVENQRSYIKIEILRGKKTQQNSNESTNQMQQLITGLLLVV
jgi:hypothetical protein